MKYLYWLGAIAVVALGIYFSMSFSVGPESIPKINFTQVSVPEDLGKQVFDKLKLEVKAAPILVFGVAPGHTEDMELIRGFFEANQEAGSKYEVLIVEPMLPYVELFNTGIYIPMKEDMPRLVEGIQKARAQGLRVVIVVPNIYSSQLLPNNPVDRLKSEYKMDLTSISISKFPLTREQEETFDPKCFDGGAVDPAGTSPLGCVVRNMARKTYRKKFEANKYSGALDQTGPKDFVIIFNRN